MQLTERLREEIRMLRERQSLMSEATLRINESLDFGTVLQGVVDSARTLTDAKYGMIILWEETGQIKECLTAGLTLQETSQIWSFPQGDVLFEYLGKIQEPLRLRDFHHHTRALGLPEFRPPMPVSPSISFMASPIRHSGERVGTFFLAEKVRGQEFTDDDEETLVMFASQAALVIANARRYGDEQRARADLEALIDTSPVGVVVIDARTGDAVSFNREAARILEDLRTGDRTTEQLLEVVTIQRADGREVSLEKHSLAQALSTGETVRAEEVVFKVSGGRRVTVLINATPIRSDDDCVDSFVVTLQDMTHLEDLERLRAEFLAMVSHELRAPLAAIKGSATTVLGDALALGVPEMLQFFRIIDQQADHMGGLINDLLDVARIETGALQVNLEQATAKGLVEEARNTFLGGSNTNDIHIDLEPEPPPVMADRRRIVQVLANLLSNAARNSPRASPIRVSAAKEGVHVAISVTDRGSGVSAERLPHLFRKFPRLAGEEETGDNVVLGWGLAICKGIVEAHGGRIWAESAGVGRGTRFTFTIPIADGVENPVHAGPSPAPGSKTDSVQEQTRILVVDDDPQTLRSVRIGLSRAGYVPVVTGDPDDVWLLLDEHRPALVLLDLVLPGTDGIALMQDIFEKADVPVIFISAYGHDDAIARAFDAGAADYIVKPFSPTQLEARIRATLRKQTALNMAEPQKPYRLGDLTIDYRLRSVKVAGRSVRLTKIEYRLLVELSVHPGEVVFYRDLQRRVWRNWHLHDLRSLRSTVKNLRRKLGDNGNKPTYIFNEPRVGYRMGAAE